MVCLYPAISFLFKTWSAQSIAHSLYKVKKKDK